jgi:membrane fusion protein, multidrug efflux system
MPQPPRLLRCSVPLVGILAGLALTPDQGMAQEPPAAMAETPLLVEIATARSAQMSIDIRLTGTIQAEDSYAASFREGGQIVEMNVDVDDRVEAGEVLARVDPTRAAAAAAAARALVGAAEAALRQAEQARDRAVSLLESGTGTQAQLDAAAEAFLMARSSRDQAATQLIKAEQALEDTVLRAVGDAIITERFADPGEVVGAGQSVMTLASESGREAVFLAPDVAGLNSFVGQSVRLIVLEGDDASFEAALSEVSPVVAETGTVEVKVALAAEQGADLPIGTPIEAEAELVQGRAITVPWSALTAMAEGPAVWTVDPDSMAVRLTPVMVAGYADDVVQIIEGLTEGDLVVGAGSHALYPGRIVTPAEGTP